MVQRTGYNGIASLLLHMPSSMHVGLQVLGLHRSVHAAGVACALVAGVSQYSIEKNKGVSGTVPSCICKLLVHLLAHSVRLATVAQTSVLINSVNSCMEKTIYRCFIWGCFPHYLIICSNECCKTPTRGLLTVREVSYSGGGKGWNPYLESFYHRESHEGHLLRARTVARGVACLEFAALSYVTNVARQLQGQACWRALLQHATFPVDSGYWHSFSNLL